MGPSQIPLPSNTRHPQNTHTLGILWKRDRPFSDTSTWQRTTPTKHTHTLGILWTRDRPFSDTSTWQHTTPTKHTHTLGILWTRDRPFSDTSTWQRTTPTKHTHPLLSRIRTRSPVNERAQTHALERAGTGFGTRHATGEHRAPCAVFTSGCLKYSKDRAL